VFSTWCPCGTYEGALSRSLVNGKEWICEPGGRRRRRGRRRRG